VLASGERYRAHIDDAAACAVEEAGQCGSAVRRVPRDRGPPGVARTRTTAGASREVARHRVGGRGGPQALESCAASPRRGRWRRSMPCSPRSRRMRAVLAQRVRSARADGTTRMSRGLALAAVAGRDLTTRRCCSHRRALHRGDRQGEPRAGWRRGAGGLGLARGRRASCRSSTRVGRVCTLICYDGFSEPHTSLERFVPLGPNSRRAVAW